MAYLPTAVHAASKSIWEGEKMGGQLQADESTRNEKNGQNIYIDSCKRTSVQETKRMDKIESKDQWNRNQNKMAYLPAVLLLLLLPRSSRCTTTTVGLPSGEPKFILLCCYRCLWARFHPTSLWLLSSLFLRHLFFFFFDLSLLPSH